ncbi:homeodomain transcription factor [Mycena alexandri]|uniref:Homeodomain transcription factor n=1 Tax=Mycena alexandri TaxID=1745969 RepID=A0AAD6TEA1_9AGAR|nr:homeodomain transcription factor [Mycena alexandri]
MPPLKSSLDKVKKPRHRHSAVQLAALNSLYEETEHPTLGQRTALAQSLGLETKSVNAYFQNKRASSKKQPRGTPYDAPGRPPSNRNLPYSTIDDDYYYPPPEAAVHSAQQFRSQQAPHLDQDSRQRNQLTDHSQFLSQSEMRPSRLQIDELQRIYRINPYPTVEELGVVAERIGMRHQSIVEWFRTQRSLDRRRVDVYPTASPAISEARPSERHSRVYPILPPISALPPVSSHPSLAGLDSARRLSAITSSEDQPYVPAARMLRRSSSPHHNHNASPYGSSSTSTSASTTSGASTSTSGAAAAALSLAARQRRGRPDPSQLNSLRRLLSKTPTPTIEERSALALEIGMDLGKVTNWFRNLRQSTRKREKSRRGSPEDDDEDDFGYGYGESNSNNDSEPAYLSSNRTSRSRSETPSVERGYPQLPSHSHSSEEEQEAVTPSPSPSPSASPSRGHRPLDLAHLVHPEDKPIGQAYTQTQFSGRVPYEDALLLLTFHRRAGMF